MKIYLIGSLKNGNIPILAGRLRSHTSHDVFDEWHAPGPEADDFFDAYRKRRGWDYKTALQSSLAKDIFEFDKKHLRESDIVVLVMPAGKSGHLELGYCAGLGKQTFILMDKEPERVDMMHQFADKIFMTEQELIDELRRV